MVDKERCCSIGLIVTGEYKCCDPGKSVCCCYLASEKEDVCIGAGAAIVWFLSY